MLAPWEKSYDKHGVLKRESSLCQPSQNYVWMGELDHKEGWVPKNWCFWIVVLGKTLDSPSESKEIKPVSLKGNQLWIFIGKTEAEAPILWPPDAKRRLIRKDPNAGKDWRQKKGAAEDEMVKQYYWLNGHELEPTLGESSFPCSSVGKESACNAGDLSLIPGSERFPGEGISYPFQFSWAFLVTQMVKNLPAMHETCVQSLGWEDPLEKGKATHSSILAWRIPWTV